MGDRRAEMRLGLCVLVAVVTGFTASTAHADSQPTESQPRRFELGPSLAMGLTTPSSGGLLTNVYALLDARLVVAIRVVGPLWARFEPGTTMSWNGTTVGDRGVQPGAPRTVRVHSVGVRGVAAVDLSSLAVLRVGGAVSYGGAALPDDACGGGARGGAGFGGILGTGFRPDPDRRWEIGAELGVWIYPYAAKCIEDRARRTSVVALQENPELAATLGVTWFLR